MDDRPVLGRLNRAHPALQDKDWHTQGLRLIIKGVFLAGEMNERGPVGIFTGEAPEAPVGEYGVWAPGALEYFEVLRFPTAERPKPQLRLVKGEKEDE